VKLHPIGMHSSVESIIHAFDPAFRRNATSYISGRIPDGMPVVAINRFSTELCSPTDYKTR
jgi:alanyl-tRNA synthetase